MVSENKDLMFADFSIIMLGIENLNNYQDLAIVGLILSLS